MENQNEDIKNAMQVLINGGIILIQQTLSGNWL